MIENSPTNAAAGDRELKIIYVQPRVARHRSVGSRTLAGEGRPGARSSIDVFHKNPRISARSSRSANLRCGPTSRRGRKTADSSVKAILRSNKNYLGPMVTWELITERIRLEREQARIQSMVENSPTNVCSRSAN